MKIIGIEPWKVWGGGRQKEEGGWVSRFLALVAGWIRGKTLIREKELMTSIWGLWGIGVVWGTSHGLKLRWVVRAGDTLMESMHDSQNYESGWQQPWRKEPPRNVSILGGGPGKQSPKGNIEIGGDAWDSSVLRAKTIRIFKNEDKDSNVKGSNEVCIDNSWWIVPRRGPMGGPCMGTFVSVE